MKNVERSFIDVVSDYTENIKKNISEGEWEGLNDLLSKRQKALEDFFSNLDVSEGKEKAVEVIKKIQAEDVVFLHLVQTEKKKMKKQHSTFKKGRESVKAYQVL